MKKTIVFVLVIMLILLSACKKENEPAGVSPAETVSDTTETVSDITESTVDSTEATVDSTEATGNTLEKYLRVDIPQLQKKNQRLYYVESGQLSKTSYSDSVYIFSSEQYTNNLQSDVYMIADVGRKYIVQDLETSDKMVIQNGMLSLSDIDGDGIDEIIVHFETSGNGGTITRIYKVKDESIVLLANLDTFDTGFRSEYENGYKMKISNKDTGYVTTLDVSKMFISDAFDEKGKVVTKDDIFVKPFSSCEVKEENKSSKFDLYCSQIVTLGGTYIGNAYTTLRYNLKTAQFEIVNSEFIQK